MRRYMMKIAEEFAKKDGCLGLITGESIGQVASQTIHSLAATNDVCTMPVFRPVIGFDKQEIVDVALKINTYETSIFRMKIAVLFLWQNILLQNQICRSSNVQKKSFRKKLMR